MLSGSAQQLPSSSCGNYALSQQHADPVSSVHRLPPAAAYSVLSNERGTAVEDTFVLFDDLLLVGGLGDAPDDAAASSVGAGAAPSHPTPAEGGGGPGAAADAYAAAPVSLFAVFDGHGGGAASQHCARRLHTHVAQRLRDALQRHPGGGAAELLDSPLVAAALRGAFEATDAELLSSGMMLDNNSGSTAVVALLTPSSIWLAWAGACMGGVAGERGGKGSSAEQQCGVWAACMFLTILHHLPYKQQCTQVTRALCLCVVVRQ